MVKAEKTDRVVEVIQEAGVKLELSMQEAEVLCSVLGSFATGGLTSPIFHALCNEDVSYHNYRVVDENNVHRTLEVAKR